MFFFFIANGKSVDATQELLAIGTSNIVNSFVQGYPGTGSFSRGAVNNASGVRTPMGGLFTGILVMVSLLMTPLFYFIPKAALASIIIAAVIFTVEVKVLKPMWRSKSTIFYIFNATKKKSKLIISFIYRNRFSSWARRFYRMSYDAIGNWHFNWNCNQCHFHFISCCKTKDLN